MSNLIAELLIGSLITVILYSMFFLFSLYKAKYKSVQIDKFSDKRNFHCNEVVWFNKHKFYIESCTKWSHTLDIDLTLRPVEYSLSFLDNKVDSREVKKVVRVYAELGKEF